MTNIYINDSSLNTHHSSLVCAEVKSEKLKVKHSSLITHLSSLMLILLLMISNVGWGQLVFNQDATAATSGTAVNTASGSGGLSWTQFSGAVSGFKVANSLSLTYSGYNGGGGNYVNVPSGTAGVGGPGSTSVSSSSNTFYYSFLLNVPTGIGTGVVDYIAGLNNNATSYFARLFIKYVSSSTYNLGISKAGGTGTYGTTTLNAGTTYLIVVRYSYTGVTNSDPVYLWVNPSLSSEPSTSSGVEASITSGVANASNFTNAFGFFTRATASTTPAYNIDAIRVAYASPSATAWSNLAAATTSTLAAYGTQLSGNVLKAATNVPLAGFTVTPPTQGANFTALTVTGATATSSDVSNVRIFRDFNGDGLINTTGGTDAAVSASAVSFGTTMSITISGETGFTSARNYLIVGDIASGATAASVGVSIGSAAFTTSAPLNTGSMASVSRTIASQSTPTTTSISPTSATAGGVGFTLTVNGTNFVSGLSTVTWGGSNRTTTFVSSTQLTASISASDIASSGSVNVGVTTSGAASASGTQSFTINSSGNATPPTLTAATGATVDGTFDVSLGTDDATWRTNISSITVGGSTLSATAYDKTISGLIRFNPANDALLQTPGNKSIIINSDGYTATSTLTQAIAVGAANANQSTLTPTSASITANGSSIQTLTVTAKDQYGNNLSAGGATVAITRSSGSGTIGSVTDNANGTYTATVTSPTATGSGVFGATLGGTTVKAGTASQVTSTITYTAGTATKLIVTGTGTQTAGSAQTITITAQDANGNTATGYTGSKSLTFSGATSSASPVTAPTVTNASSAAIAFGSSTSITFTNGVGSGSMILYNAESATIAVTDGTISSTLTDRLSVTVSAGASTKLAITSSAVTTTAGVASSSITVQRQDAFGNANSTDANRTINLSSNSTGAVTFNPVSLTISNGSSSTTFTYTDTKSGTPTITLASTSPSTITSANQGATINAAAANKLAVTTQPIAPTRNGNALATQPVVTVQDQYGNTITGSSASITASAAEATWTLGGTTSVSASLGVATFTNLTATSSAAVASATITFASTGLASATSTPGFAIPAPLTGLGAFPEIVGGFEAQSLGSVTSSYAQATQYSTWSLNNSSSATSSISSTGGRSGPFYISYSSTSSGTRRIQSPTVSAASSGGFQASTNYIIQYYYRTAGVNSFGTAISIDGTTNWSTLETTGTLSTTSGAWTKRTVLLTSNAGTSPTGISATNSRYGMIQFRSNASMGSNAIDIDDVVVYAGSSADITLPGAPGAVTVGSATNTSLNVSWGASSDIDGGGYVVVRYTSSPAADNAPNQQGIYTTGNTITNGTGSLTGTVVYIGTSTSFTDNSLSTGTDYWYKVYTVDKAYNYSAAAEGSGTTTGASSPTKLSFTTVPSSATVGTGFSVTVKSLDDNGNARNVTDATQFSLSNTGGGTLSGTTSGTIASGSNSVTLTGLILSSTGTGITLTATQTSGSITLADGTSTEFTVVPANPTSFTATTNSSAQINLASTANSNTDNIVVVTNGTGTFTAPTAGSAPGSVGDILTGSGGNIVYLGAASGLSNHTSLTSNQIYYYRAFSYDGNNLYSSGSSANATTLASVTTGTSGTITSTSAVISNNSVTAGGGATLTARGLAIGTSASPTTLTSSGATATGSFNQTASSLSAQTQYFVRAYATNAGGTSYGSDISFRTLSAPATAQPTTLSATALGTTSISVSLTGSATYPSSGATKSGYLLLYGTGTPALVASPNGQAPASAISVGTQIAVTEANAPTAPSVSGLTATGLAALTTYNLTIIPYTWDGTNPETYNYFTTGAKTTSVTTLGAGYYWNGGDNTQNPALGGSGNWSGTNNWRIDNNGSQATWADANPAYLAGTGGTVTLSASVAPSSTTVQSSGYTLATTGSSAITMSGDIGLGSNNITVSPITGADLTLSGIISGTASLTKTGTGTLLLSNGSNSYSGGTTINAGTLSIDGANRLGASTGALTINAGTFKVLSGISSSRNFVIGNSASTIDINSSQTYTFASASTVSGSGSGRLNKIGAGSLIFPSTNATNHTWSGGTTISEGILQVNKNTDLGSSPASATVNNLVLDGGVLQSATSFSIAANRGVGITSNGGVFNTASGTTLTVAGIIADNGGAGFFTKNGPGGLTLSNTNTYSGGTTVTQGTLTISAAANLGAIPASPTTNVILNGGTLAIITNSFSTSANLGLGLGTSGGTIDVASSRTFTINGVIADNGAAGSLTKTGAGSLVLANTNTYTGTTSVSAGTLNLTGTLSSSSAVTISSGASLIGMGTAAGTVSNSGTISPNTSSTIGTLNTGSQTWNSGSTYVINIGNVSGSAGTINDLLAITGSLTTGGTVNITLSGTISNFSYATAASWTIATTSSGITNNASYTISTTGITNSIGSGIFNISVSGNNLLLNYTPGAPSVAFSLTTSSTSANAFIGSSNNVIYQANLDVTGNNTTFTGVTVSSISSDGSYNSSDIAANGFKLWISTNSTFSTGTATQIGNSLSSSTGSGESLAFTSNINEGLTVGTTYYLYITVDYRVSSTVGRNITLTSSTSDYSFTSSPATNRTGTMGNGSLQTISNYKTYTWTGTSSAWLTNSNWDLNTYPGEYFTGSGYEFEIARFNNNTQLTSNINMNTQNGNHYLGCVLYTTNATSNRLIGNSSTSQSGILSLFGVILNSTANVVINNQSSGSHTFQNGAGTMRMAFANSTDNIIQIDGIGNVIISSNITSAAGPISVMGSGSGYLELTGSNTLATSGNRISIKAAELRGNTDAAFGAAPGSVQSSYIVIDGGTLATSSGTNYTLNSNRGIQLGKTVGTAISVNTSGTLTYNGIIANNTTDGILTKRGAGTLVLGGNNTYTGLTTVTGGTLTLNRTGGATIPSTNDAIINGGTLKISSNQTLDSLTLTSGTLTVDANVTLTINSAFIYTSGTITGTGTIVYGQSGKLVYNGASQQTSTSAEWPSSSGPSGVTIGSSGVILHDSRTVSDLTLNGILRTNANTITVSESSVSGASTSAYVNGNLAFSSIPTTGNPSRKFEIGDANAYAPVTVAYTTNLTVGGTLTASTSQGDHPSISSSIIDPNKSINRTWTLTPTTMTGGAYTGTFDFTNASADAGFTSVVNSVTRRFNSSEWNNTTKGTNTSTTNVITGETGYGAFQIGNWASFTVTFSANYTGGSVTPATKTVTYASTYGDLPTPTRTGYTFNGWFTASSAGTEITSESEVTITADQTLYAQWTPITYTITFDGNAGSLGTLEGTMSDQSIPFNSSANLTANEYTIIGYVFTGWATSITGPVVYANEASYTMSSASNATLYAKWQSIQFADFRTNGAVNFTSGTNWQYNNGNGWRPAPQEPVSTNKISITHAATMDVDFAVTTPGTLTLSGAGTLEVSAGKTLAISGTTNFGGNSVVLKSTAAGTAAIGAIGGTNGNLLSGASNVTVERYIGSGKRAWRLLTIPVTGTTIRNAWAGVGANENAPLGESAGSGTLITGHGFSSSAAAKTAGFDWFSGLSNQAFSSIRFYDSVNNHWNSVSNTPNILAAPGKQGYMLFVRGDRTKTWFGSTITTLKPTGALKIGSQNITITQQYEVVGNPYASPIDLNAVYNNSANSGKILRNFWIWDATLSTQTAFGGFRALSDDDNNGNYTMTGGDGDVSDYLKVQSGQAFFVEKSGSYGTPQQIVIEENDKIGSNGYALRPYAPMVIKGSIAKIYVNLQEASSNSIIDGVAVRLNNNYKQAADESYDATKFNSFNENLSIVRNDRYLSIESRPLPTEKDTVHLSFWNLGVRSYKMRINTTNWDAKYGSAALIDRVTNKSTPIDMTGGYTDYTFSVSNAAQGRSSDRFVIVFKDIPTQQQAPVRFTKLNAEKKDAAVEVKWEASEVEGINSFEVERSADGMAFSKVNSVAVVNATGAQAYTIMDNQPLIGWNYYRIRNMEANGKVSFSNIAKVQWLRDAQIRIYPNVIANGKINLLLQDQQSGRYQVVLTTLSGQRVYSNVLQHAEGTSSYSLELKGKKRLSGGEYILTVYSNNEVKQTEKVVIQ